MPHWGYSSLLLWHTPVLIQPFLASAGTRDFQIPKCCNCAVMPRTAQEKSDSLWISAEGEIRCFITYKCMKLSPGSPLIYIVCCIISLVFWKHTESSNSESWSIKREVIFGVDGLKLRTVPDVWLSVCPTKKKAVSLFFGACIWCPLWDSWVPFCSWQQSLGFH